MMRAGPIPSADVTRDAPHVFVTLDHERCHTRDDTLIQLGGHTAPWHDELSSPGDQGFIICSRLLAAVMS